MIDEKARVFSDRDWWQSAGDAFDLDLRGWTDRNEASFADKKTGRRLEMPGWFAERILAYESAKPKEAEGLKLGSRLTVEGVEAVVVRAEPVGHQHRGWKYSWSSNDVEWTYGQLEETDSDWIYEEREVFAGPSYDGREAMSQRSAMLSAAGER